MSIFNKKKKTKMMTEKEVLDALEISDFRHMTKNKIMKFTSLVPQMDKEVAKTALQQFPHFAQMSIEVINCYKEIMGTVLRDNALSMNDFYNSCDTVILALNELLRKDKLKFKQKKSLIDNMIQILKMKDDKDRENKVWLSELIKTTSIAATTILGIVGAIIGINLVNN